jgi:two-component system, chemotaxis family, protein-glutamate methylesterase/glutaminase
MSGGVVVVGASWGGLRALERLLQALPGDFGLPIAVVQHRGAADRAVLCDLLSVHSRLPVRESEDKDALTPGRVLVAPPGYHMLVEERHVALSLERPVHFSRPSVDVLFESAAAAHGAAAIGVVLTGSNADGAAGLRILRRRGGFAIVQDPDDAERCEMPAAALAEAGADAVVPLAGVAPLLVKLAAR